MKSWILFFGNHVNFHTNWRRKSYGKDDADPNFLIYADYKKDGVANYQKYECGAKIRLFHDECKWQKYVKTKS